MDVCEIVFHPYYLHGTNGGGEAIEGFQWPIKPFTKNNAKMGSIVFESISISDTPTSIFMYLDTYYYCVLDLFRKGLIEKSFVCLQV